MSALRPAFTARVCSPEARVGLAEADAVAVRRLLELGDQLVVGLARRRVGDEREPDVASVAARGRGDGDGGGQDRAKRMRPGAWANLFELVYRFDGD